MTNLNLYGTVGADLLPFIQDLYRSWMKAGVACMSLILWHAYRAAGLSVLICMLLLYISVPSSLDQVVFFAILPASIKGDKKTKAIVSKTPGGLRGLWWNLLNVDP